jgi:hypothetical protein
MGWLDRETGMVRVKRVGNRKRRTLQEEVRANVEPGSEVFIDELASYTALRKDYVHQFVNHAEKYVEGNIHTNGIENFWSLLKRGLKGPMSASNPSICSGIWTNRRSGITSAKATTRIDSLKFCPAWLADA